MRYVYILRSVKWPEKLYVGVTLNPNRRLVEHNQSKCTSTRKFKPWKVVFLEKFEDEKAAFQRERQIKKWSRVKKEVLIAGEKQSLKSLSKRKKCKAKKLDH